MLANAERYDVTTDGEFTFQVKVRNRGFIASALLKDRTWDVFAESSSVSTFVKVMEAIVNSRRPASASPVLFGVL